MAAAYPDDMTDNDKAVTAAMNRGWDAITLDGEKMTVETEEGDVTLRASMVIREASQAEYDAMKRGYNGDTDDGETYQEQEYWHVGNDDAHDKDPDETAEDALAGRVPRAIVYHDDPYGGPKYFGRSFDFTDYEDFSAHQIEERIENGDFVELELDEYVSVRYFDGDTGLMHEVYYDG